jgi:hypothetical protein
MFNIRPAQISDMPRLLELGKQWFENSRYAFQILNPQKAEILFRDAMRVLNAQRFHFDVCETRTVEGVKVVGMMLAGIFDDWFTDDLHAMDYGVYIDPAFRKRSGLTALKMICRYRDWARSCGLPDESIYLGCVAPGDGARVVRMDEMAGFHSVGQFMSLGGKS